MPRAPLSLLACFWITLGVAAALEAADDELERLSWLAGTWRSEIEGVVIEEHWIDSGGGLMLGLSHTLAGGKAVGFEFLRIETRGDDVVYVAQPNGKLGTDFELTEIERQSAVFENPAHDHPKRLRYRLASDGVLRVRLDGDEGVQEFEFQRVDDP